MNTTGGGNTAIGEDALINNNGDNNIALGVNAGFNITTGNNNIDIGNQGVAGESGIIHIGTAGTQTAAFIAGILGATVPSGVGVVVGAVRVQHVRVAAPVRSVVFPPGADWQSPNEKHSMTIGLFGHDTRAERPVGADLAGAY